MNDDDFPTTMSPAMHAGVRAIAEQRARRSPTSRNTREGRYAGCHERRHVRARDIATTVWLGDEVLFVSPVPSPSAAWGVIYRRLTKPEAP